MSLLKKRIALIEDDVEFSSVLQELLTLHGFDVTAFASAEDFTQQYLRSAYFGCILSDIRLKNRSGLHLQSQLNACNNKTPLIFITGHSTKAIEDKVMKAGCRGVFLKPLNNAELVRAIQAAVAV